LKGARLINASLAEQYPEARKKGGVLVLEPRREKGNKTVVGLRSSQTKMERVIHRTTVRIEKKHGGTLEGRM